MMRYFCTLCTLLLLAGCGGDVKETLGLTRKAPDEFRVMSRPPLSVPKEFRLYSPEQAESYSAARTKPNARAILFSDRGVPPSTSKQDTLLSRIGEGDASIREKLAAEEKADATQRKEASLLDKLNERPKAEPVLDAAAERKRISNAKRDGKTLTGDDTPTFTREETTLDWLFN